MVTVLEILGVLLVLFVAAAVATREGDLLVDAPRDCADLDLPDGPLHAEDIARVRFGLTVRGYRMAEVDRVLERVADELGSRDARIAELLGAPAGAVPTDAWAVPTDGSPVADAGSGGHPAEAESHGWGGFGP